MRLACAMRSASYLERRSARVLPSPPRGNNENIFFNWKADEKSSQIALKFSQKIHTRKSSYLSKSVQILLSRTQAGPGRKVKQEQVEMSRPRTIFLADLCTFKYLWYHFIWSFFQSQRAFAIQNLALKIFQKIALANLTRKQLSAYRTQFFLHSTLLYCYAIPILTF